jgi:hypothetical protein
MRTALPNEKLVHFVLRQIDECQMKIQSRLYWTGMLHNNTEKLNDSVFGLPTSKGSEVVKRGIEHQVVVEDSIEHQPTDGPCTV